MAWAQVQGAGADQSGTTGTLSFPGSCTPGSILQCCIRLGGGTITSVSDPTNGSWTARTTLTDSDGNRFGIYDVVNTASSALTVTLVNSTSVTRRWTIEEFTETGTLSYDTQDAGKTESDVSAASTTGLTTATNNELLAGGCELSGGATMSGASSTIVIRNVASGKICSARKTITTASGSNTLNFTWSGIDHYATAAVAYKTSGGGGGGATQRKNSLLRVGVGR